MGRWTDVTQKTGRLALGGQDHALVMRRMSGGQPDADARQDFPLAVDEFKTAGFDHRIPVGRKVAG